MKYLFLALTLLACSSAQAQVKVTQGSNSPDFTLNRQRQVTSFNTNDASYMVLTRTERFEKINTLIVTDKNSSINIAKEIRINMGVFNDTHEVVSLLVVGNTPVVFIENHNKASGKNTLTARMVDKAGNVSSTEMAIGSVDFTKITNSGDWYTSLTPDKKHVAVISKLPYEKNQPEQFKYYLLDDQLKEVSKGQFSFEGNTKKISVFDFMASDKGDYYIISEDYDKTYKFPILYKFSEGGKGNIIPVMMADPDLKNLSYTSTVNPQGDLIMAGYTQKNQTFTVGDTKATGTWLFNSLKPNEVKTFKFDAPLTNCIARNIVYNGDTFYLVGEQYKAEKEPNRATGMAALSAPEIFNYTHNDIMVTAFSITGDKKFELSLSRRWNSRDTDSEFMVASGIINNKLALIYNDAYGKYIDDNYYRNNKLPVAVLINNDGLMENPITFAKDLDVKVSSYTLHPQFFGNNAGQMVLLSVNASSVKAITFK